MSFVYLLQILQMDKILKHHFQVLSGEICSI